MKIFTPSEDYDTLVEQFKKLNILWHLARQDASFWQTEHNKLNNQQQEIDDLRNLVEQLTNELENK